MSLHPLMESILSGAMAAQRVAASCRPAWCEAGDAPCEYPGCHCGPEVRLETAPPADTDVTINAGDDK